MTNPPVTKLLDLSDRHALVTGGGSGIGAAIARRLAEAGADVAISYRTSAEGAGATVATIEGLGCRAVAIEANVADASSVSRLIDKTVAALGGLDMVINNAGVYPLSPVLEMDETEWDTVIDANLKGVHLCTQAAARLMATQNTHGRSAIVNIASIEASSAGPAHAHYSAAKAGVVHYTRAAAQELGPKGIRVNTVSPGLINRPGLEEAWPEGVERYCRAAPLGRIGDATDIADACLFLVSPAARWITGAELVVDGGVLVQQTY